MYRYYKDTIAGTSRVSQT